MQGCSALGRANRRQLYRLAKRTLCTSLVGRWVGSRASLRRVVRAFLRRKARSYLLHLLRRPAYLVAALTVLLAGPGAYAEPPIELSAIAINTNDGGFVINGQVAGDFSGRRVSAAGDVNGDGLADIIVGAFGADPNGNYSGKSYVVFGKSDGMVVNLSAVSLPDSVIPGDSGGFAINGEAFDDRSGWSVSGAGDVNGDGLDDLIVGAFSADPNGYDSGRSYVIFGKVDGTAVNLANITAGVGGFAINGEMSFALSGFSVSGAGDVNGDGFDDVIVGARDTLASGVNSGRSYVVFGKATGTQVNLSNVVLGIGGFAIDGQAAGDLSGGSVSAAGDVNGDGLADVIVGAIEADHPSNGNTESGKSYVVFGKAAGLFPPVDLNVVAAGMLGAGGFVINAEFTNDLSGWSVSAAGDVNGDGLADLVIGECGTHSDGYDFGNTYVVFGKADTASIELSDIAMGGNAGGFVMMGEAMDDLSGWSVSGAGDVNGDGLADIVASAKYADPNYANSGRSYVVFGKTGGGVVLLSDVAAGMGGFVMNGELLNDNSGFSVSGAGDVDGDGLADIIIGARNADIDIDLSTMGPDITDIVDAGKSYVVFNPVIPKLSATQKGRSRTGDGVGGAPVVPTFFENARATIDYSDDDTADNGSGGASEEVVTLVRSDAGVTNLPGLSADVVWELSTNRVGWSSADVTFKYTDAEISGLDEGTLELYKAPALTGPWTLVSAQSLDINRNTIGGNVTGFSYFALAGAPPPPMPLHGWPAALALLASGVYALRSRVPGRFRRGKGRRQV